MSLFTNQCMIYKGFNLKRGGRPSQFTVVVWKVLYEHFPARCLGQHELPVESPVESLVTKAV